MKSVMKHLFSQIPRAQISRSVFDRSHGWKSTFDSGYLVPFLVDEVLPGDSYKVKFNFLACLSTPIVPTMDNLFLDTFYFFVPYRLLWKHWEQFNGQQDILEQVRIILYRRLQLRLRVVFRLDPLKIILVCRLA